MKYEINLLLAAFRRVALTYACHLQVEGEVRLAVSWVAVEMASCVWPAHSRERRLSGRGGAPGDHRVKLSWVDEPEFLLHQPG